MDYGAAFEGETDDVRIARLFERASLPVARIFEILPEAGALVLEDLGDETLEAALGHASEGRRPSRDELYRSSVELSGRDRHARNRGARDVRPRARTSVGRREVPVRDEILPRALHGRFSGPSGRAAGASNGGGVARVDVAAHPRVLCHRDYHSRNIMVRPNGELAMVDIQDARWGPDTYDIASLLRDAYVDLTEDEVDRLFGLVHQSTTRYTR